MIKCCEVVRGQRKGVRPRGMKEVGGRLMNATHSLSNIKAAYFILL